jgi:3-hydroxyacyl-CoA dehydrogenase
VTIERVAVIGAGVMGAGIAAHLANAGLPVLLLDVRSEPPAAPSAVAAAAVERLLRTDPAPLMERAGARLITPGNVEDGLGGLADCDWIIEAVIEDLAAKQALYRRVDAVRKPGSIVSSNTSTLKLSRLVEGLPEGFRRDFLIAHFFNPPRYMRLLELVAGPQTRADAVDEVRELADHRLGKGVVDAKDTPGFVANRIGVFWIQAAVVETVEGGLTIEEADAVMGRPVGVPKTGIFGLLDLVGLDLQPKVDASLAAALAPDDPYQALRRDFPLLRRLIAEGYTGRKGKGGFYRLNREGGGRVKEALDLATGTWRTAERPRLDSVDAAKGGLRALLAHPDKGGRYAWRVLSATLAYAAALVPEIADDIVAVDRAMRLGFAWKWGPFELIDRIGAPWLAERLAAEGRTVPPLLGAAAAAEGFYRVAGGRRQHLRPDGLYADVTRPAGVLLLEDVKLAGPPLAKNGSASLWDLGDGVACLEFHAKMNALDAESLALARQALDIVGKRMKALVIYNEGENFSVGANIGLALFAANVALWPMIESLVEEGQKTWRRIKYAPFPVVGAPAGMALGGACELLLHCAAIEAHAESYIGLVETGVGLVPGWGGCAELLARAAARPGRPGGPMPPVMQAFETIGLAKVSRSAAEARALGFLSATDGITMNRDRLLAAAKRRALALAEGYRPPAPVPLPLPGPTGRAALGLALEGLVLQGKATAHDRTVALALAEVLTGGPEADAARPTTEEQIGKLERQAFMRLLREPATLARMEHTLATGKPLRN